MPIIIIFFYNYLQRQKIDLQKKTCQSSPFLFSNYLQNFNAIILINFWINLSYMTLISHNGYLLIFFVPLLLSLTAQCGFEAHKTNVVTSLLPSPTHPGSGQNI
jgi:hypothetical protein